MTTYYDNYAASLIHEKKPPQGIRVDIKEFEQYPGVVFLVAYVSDMADVPESRVHEFVDWINELLKKLNGHPLLMAKYAFHLDTEGM